MQLIDVLGDYLILTAAVFGLGERKMSGVWLGVRNTAPTNE